MVAVLIIIAFLVFMIFLLLAVIVGYLLGLSRGCKRVIRFAERELDKINSYLESRNNNHTNNQ